MKAFKHLLFSSLLLLTTSGIQAQKTQQINNIIQQVHLDSIKQTVKDLTGLNPVTIEGTDYQLLSRYRTEQGNSLAARYFSQRLKEYGYQPEKMGFDKIGENIYAIKKGTVHPDKAYLICAHYDAIAAYYDKAIGADDNASGCAAVMEAARLFQNVQTEYSVIFVFFDEEELGLLGSEAFTALFDFAEMGVQGVINVDMIGYDDNKDFRADLNTRDIGYSVQMASIVKSLNDTFAIGLDIKILNPGSTASDHAPFWNKGISAVFLEEDNKDFNRYYHSIFDSLKYFHDSFFYKNTRLALASLGWFVLNGNFVLSSANPEIPLTNVYPNPASSTIHVNLSTSDGYIKLYDMQGRLCMENTLINGENKLNTGLLKPGIYSAEIKEGTYTSYRKIIILNR